MKVNVTILILKVLLMTSLDFYANHPNKVKEWHRGMGIRNKQTAPRKFKLEVMERRQKRKDAKAARNTVLDEYRGHDKHQKESSI